MLDQQVTLTTGTLLNLIRRRGVEPHTVLASTPVWEDERARRAADERADAELRGYGLYGRGGVHSGLQATLDAVARPAVEYFGWINGGHDGKPLNFTLLAGSAGGEGFVLARNTDHEGVVLVSVRPEEILDNFVAQIPRLGPGRGQQLRVPKSQASGGKRRSDSYGDDFSVMRSGTPNPGSVEADELRRVLKLPRLGGGSLYAAARGRTGRRERVERPLNYIDTTEGRWLTEEVPGSGEPLIAFTPGSPQVIAERLRHLASRIPVS
ncbi:ESX secretion-associated protein EspG [Prauserella cavernicola]|uniref:ESX secretion-associated protein EspG n=1 Tax=Prauserella cavernicola TaxID=2800127 RepID=A0A934V4D9_9PSEU|nr:ESX secretion-associated protein EspG [Prauserella cavernicola]MBK1784614.1 ESX secretion-associated protein EspG [Prauserella cavernicola]